MHAYGPTMIVSGCLLVAWQHLYLLTYGRVGVAVVSMEIKQAKQNNEVNSRWDDPRVQACNQ